MNDSPPDVPEAAHSAWIMFILAVIVIPILLLLLGPGPI